MLEKKTRIFIWFLQQLLSSSVNFDSNKEKKCKKKILIFKTSAKKEYN